MGLLTGIAKRPGAFENGEIDPTDASQVEIYCSWPELVDAPEEVVKQLNRHMGFLRIANPGMTLSEWAIKVNDLKDKRLIPGQIRQRHLHWDGLDITELMHKLLLLQQYGTVDVHNLPGYETAHPAVLTSDATGHCLLEDSPVGRQISHHTGRVTHIDEIAKWDQIIQRRSRKSILTPAILIRQGIELHGKENMPERTEIMRRIPDDGPATLRARCIFCGTLVQVRGQMWKGKPHYEIDTHPTCPHIQLRIKEYPGRDGRFHRLYLYHYQNPPKFQGHRKAEADKRKNNRSVCGDEINDSVLRKFLHKPPSAS